MITTAAFILAEAYESTHNDDYESNSGVLVVLVVFMWFDWSMLQMAVNAL